MMTKYALLVDLSEAAKQKRRTLTEHESIKITLQRRRRFTSECEMSCDDIHRHQQVLNTLIFFV